MKSFQAQTHYEVLEISVGASLTEVKSAYERLSQLYSDDQVVLYGLIDPSRAIALRARLKEAVEVLTDEDRRDAYDVKLGLPPRNPPKPAAPPKPPTPAVVSSGAVAATGWGAFTYATNAPVAAPVASQGSSYSWPISAPRVVAVPPRVVQSPAPVAAPPAPAPAVTAPTLAVTVPVAGATALNAAVAAAVNGGVVAPSPGVTAPAAGATASVSGVTAVNGGVAAPASGATALNAGATALNAGVVAPSPGATGSAAGVTALNGSTAAPAPGATALYGGTATAAAGATALAPGVAALNAGGTALSAGGTALNAGATALNAGATALNAGGTALNAGGTALSAGVTALSAGVTALPPTDAEPGPQRTEVAPTPSSAPEADVADRGSPKPPSAATFQLDLGMSTGAASNWGVREVVETRRVVAPPPVEPEPPPAAPVEPVPEPAPAAVAALPDPTANMSSTSPEPFTAPSMTPAPPTTAISALPVTVAPPPEPEVPRLADDAEVAIVPARATPAREFKVEARPKPYEVPNDVEFNGGLLRQVRMARGLSLSQLAERTRIGSKHLENVENDRYDALPAAVYLRGILMNLARELGLDGLRVSKSYLAFVEAHRSKG